MKQALLFLLLAAAQISMAQFAGGTGSSNDPYLISTYIQLDSVRNHLSSTFRLINDIDASTSTTQHGDSGFLPIGDFTTNFTGIFHGSGHKIMHLYINRFSNNYISSNYYIGLFGYAGSAALIDSVGMTDAAIKADGDVGGLAGECDGTINESYTTGSVTGSDWVVGGLVGCAIGAKINYSYSTATVNGYGQLGGLAGQIVTGTVTNSYATGLVTGTNYSVGGLIGSFNGAILNCYATNSVIGVGRVGGLIGTSTNATISYCYSKGSVIGTEKYIGGFIGYSDGDTVTYSYSTNTTTGGTFDIGGFAGANVNNSSISLCYATGNTTGGTAADDSSCGGFAGYNEFGSSISSCYARGNALGYQYIGGLTGNNNGSVSNCYATGYVTGMSNVGGLIGVSAANNGTATDCFWDMTTSGITTSIGGTGKSTIEMQTQSTFIADGWSSNVWKIDSAINNGYPYLAWQTGTTTTSVLPASKSTPKIFTLNQNYPNPFNPSDND